jgi:hypothetical protein
MIQDRLHKLKRRQAAEVLQLEQAIAKLGAELKSERQHWIGARLRRLFRSREE